MPQRFSPSTLDDRDQLFRLLQSMGSDLERVQQQITALNQQVVQPRVTLADVQMIRAALQAKGAAPLNVAELLGILAQSQRGFAAVASSFAALPDPSLFEVGTFGAVIVGTVITLYLVTEGTPRAWTLYTIGAGSAPADMMTTDTGQAVSGIKTYSVEQIFGALTALTLGGTAATHMGKHQFLFHDEEVNLAGVAFKDTTTDFLDANALVLPVLLRVTQTISGGGVTQFQGGDPTVVERFLQATTSLTAGTTFWCYEHWRASQSMDAYGPTQTAAARIRLTADAAPTQGKVRVVSCCLAGTPPTS